MDTVTQPKLMWFLEAYNPITSQWESISHRGLFHRGHFQRAEYSSPIAITDGTPKDWKKWLTDSENAFGLTRIATNQLSNELRGIYQQQAYLLTGHHLGLSAYSITLADFAKIIREAGEMPTPLNELWQTLRYGYNDELASHAQTNINFSQINTKEWKAIRLVAWRNT